MEEVLRNTSYSGLHIPEQFGLLVRCEDNSAIAELKCFLSSMLIVEVKIKLVQWGTLINWTNIIIKQSYTEIVILLSQSRLIFLHRETLTELGKTRMGSPAVCFFTRRVPTAPPCLKMKAKVKITWSGLEICWNK